METFKFGNGNWAVKDGYALAYNDENNNFKPLPFDFTRASNATRVNKQGLIEAVGIDKPRIDFTDNTKGHLLLEPQRTNSLTYSTLAFNGGSIPIGWTVGFGTGTFSHTETTYKGQGAVKHTQITAGRSYLAEAINLSASTTYTLRVEFDRDNSSGIDDDDFILSTVSIDNSFSKRWSDVDDNGVLEVQFTTGADATGELRIGFGVSGDEDGGKTIVFSMPQIEAGSYATSYIPTSASTAVRQADICNGAGNSTVFNNSEGVLFAEFAALANELTHRRISISDGTTSNLVYISFDTASNRILANANGKILVYTVSDETEFQKVAVYYNATAPKLFVNGVLRETETAMTAISGLNELAFDSGVGTNNFYGKLKQLVVFNEALTDSELQQLTS